MKKLTAVVLALVIALSCMGLSAFAATSKTAISSFKVCVSAGEAQDSISAVSWWKSDETDTYYIFLPGYADASALTVWYEANGSVTVNGTEIASGEKTTVFANNASGVIACDGQEFKYRVLTSASIPAMYITTQSGSLDAVHADKAYKEAGTIRIDKKNGKAELKESALDYIKGRGNSTWGYAKKPYNIKLAKKADLFGMGKSKKWSLIANHGDETLIRNLIIYSIAQELGIENSVKCMPVDLYINNEYKGNYLLTSRIEPDSNRVNINDLDDANEEANPDIDIEALPQAGTYGSLSGYMAGTVKYIDIPNDPADITGGYILEQEIAARYTDEVSGFVSKKGQPVNLKSPEFATKAEVEYIASLYQAFEDALYAENGTNADGKHYSELIDMQSLVDMYIINEWTSNLDTGLTSSYLYKPEGETTLYAGPLWDYDNAFNYGQQKRFGIPFSDATQWSACHTILYRNSIFGTQQVKTVPTIYNLASKKADFQAAAAERWSAVYKDKIDEWNSRYMRESADEILDSAIMNAVRWNVFKTEDITAVEAAYYEAVAGVIEFATIKADLMDKGLGTVQPTPDSMNANAFTKLSRKFLSAVNDAVIAFVRVCGMENVDFSTGLSGIISQIK